MYARSAIGEGCAALLCRGRLRLLRVTMEKDKLEADTAIKERDEVSPPSARLAPDSVTEPFFRVVSAGACEGARP